MDSVPLQFLHITSRIRSSATSWNGSKHLSLFPRPCRPLQTPPKILNKTPAHLHLLLIGRFKGDLWLLTLKHRRFLFTSVFVFLSVLPHCLYPWLLALSVCFFSCLPYLPFLSACPLDYLPGLLLFPHQPFLLSC